MDREKTEAIILESLNRGIVLGLKESQKALNMFLDKKQNEFKMPEYISRKELNVFMDAYIEAEEASNNLSTTENK